MELGVRVAYPERGEYDWYEVLKPYPAVEVAFRDPEGFPSLPIDKILSPWQSGGAKTKALSIHLPHVKPNDLRLFSKCLQHSAQIADELGTPYMVIHPQNGQLDAFVTDKKMISALGFTLRGWIKGQAGVLLRPSHFLCWETFLSKRRLVNTIESIAEAGFYACYDTSHMRRDSEGVLSDLFTYKDTIKVVHLSNFDEHGQHLPLRQGILDMRTVLAYLDKNFDGPVILEYLQKYHHLYLDDIRWARMGRVE